MRKVIIALAVASMATGIGLAVLGNRTLRWAPPPRPPGSAALGARQPGAGPRPSAPPARPYRPQPMARSRPLALAIPAIGVRARIISLGLAADGSARLPPLATPFVTSWYAPGPAPGQRGTAIVFGHVDSAAVGPAVFYNLGRLRRGDLIEVTLADRRTALFRVYAAELYQKARLPAAIYSYTQWPTLRLITCGGTFDHRTRHYLGNTVVFAEYVGQG